MDAFDKFLIGVMAAAILSMPLAISLSETGADTDYWEPLNSECIIHVTQERHSWIRFTEDEPERRQVYCETDLVQR